jgi:hypothetical protein
MDGCWNSIFASLQNGGVATVDAAGNTLDKWPQARIVVSDGVPTDHVWIKPEKWNQGGYDAPLKASYLLSASS